MGISFEGKEEGVKKAPKKIKRDLNLQFNAKKGSWRQSENWEEGGVVPAKQHIA